MQYAQSETIAHIEAQHLDVECEIWEYAANRGTGYIVASAFESDLIPASAIRIWKYKNHIPTDVRPRKISSSEL